MKELILAHISDLHFSKVDLSPMQLLSKRFLGNMNLLFSRRHQYTTHSLDLLPELFKNLGVSHVVISGDLTTTARAKEFQLARKYVEGLQNAGFKTFVIPGNHDVYTKSAYEKQVFYDYFPQSYENGRGSLKTDGLTMTQLDDSLAIILLDTAKNTPRFAANGFFTEAIGEKLDHALSNVPTNMQVMIANHFPTFKNDKPHKWLFGSELLESILTKHQGKVLFYLSGHSHRHSIADLRGNGLPIFLDSGSTAKRELGSFNLLKIKKNSSIVEGWHHISDQSIEKWNIFRKDTF